MKYILKYNGGSHSYGLNTPSSDIDLRGIFMHTNPEYILGLKRWDYLENKKEGNDEMFFEIRHFFNLLKNGNTQAYECLFLSYDCRIENTEEYNLLIRNREFFLDSEKLFKSLLGYIQSERRLAIGERTGKLGGKRIDQLEKYGFSPKNFVQLVRLSWAGSYFFNKGIFPVKISDYDKELSSLL
jgi:predicted nucleotidyltransferase